MAWTPVTKQGDYTSGKRVGTQPGQQNLEADLTTLVNGVNAAGQYVDSHNTDAEAHSTTHYTKTQVDGFVGASRTTETIMGAYAALTTHKSGNDHDARYPTRTDMAAAISNAALGVQTDGVVSDRPGAAAHWTLRQSSADKFDYELDASGNLLQRRWDGAAWQTVATWTLATGAVAFSGAVTVAGVTSLQAVTATEVQVTTIKVNGATYYGRLADASSITSLVSGDFYFDTTEGRYKYYDGAEFAPFGLSQAEVRTEALKAALIF